MGIEKVSSMSAEREISLIYTIWKDVVAILWIVSFTILTSVKIPMFNVRLNFALYPILIAMFFLDRYSLLFIAGLSVIIAEWFLENYYLMPWYFVVYGIGAFIAFKYIYSDTSSNDDLYRHLKLHSNHDSTTRNNAYIIYSTLWIIIGSSITDLITTGKASTIIKFPFHIIEVISASTLAILTILIYEKLTKKRSKRSSSFLSKR